MNCEYVRENYNVPAEIGRIINYKGRKGVISEDRGNYIGVTFYDEKPGTVSNFHPTTEGMTYEGMGKVRAMTRSQKRYQDYLHSEVSESFHEWIKYRMYEAYENPQAAY